VKTCRTCHYDTDTSHDVKSLEGDLSFCSPICHLWYDRQARPPESLREEYDKARKILEDNPQFRPGDQFDSCYAICPYCGSAIGDCQDWVSQDPDISECFRCGKKYRVWAEYSVDYYTEPVED